MSERPAYSPAFVRAKTIVERTSANTFDSDMRYIQMYLSFYYEPSEHKELIKELIKTKFKDI